MMRFENAETLNRFSDVIKQLSLPDVTGYFFLISLIVGRDKTDYLVSLRAYQLNYSFECFHSKHPGALVNILDLNRFSAII